MDENPGENVNFSRETAEQLFDLLCSEKNSSVHDKKKDTLCDTLRAALRVPQQHSLESTKEEARASLQRSTEKVAQAQSALAEALHHGSERDQRTASAVIDAEETRLRGSQAAYEAAAGRALDATAESAEGKRRAAYAKSEKAHKESLLALQGYEPLAQEMSKLFRVLSFHADLAMADVEAADAARISPHVANAADHLKKIIQEQERGDADAVTKHALAALQELAAHVRG
jgi:hypothetical protein